MWVGSTQFIEGSSGIKRWRKGKLSLHLSWDTHRLPPSDTGASDSLAFRLRSWFTQTAPQFSGLWTRTELYWLSCSQACRWQMKGLQDFITTWANSYNKSPFYIHVSISTPISISPIVLFLWKTLTNIAFLPWCVKSLSKLNCQKQNSWTHPTPKYFYPLPFQIFFLYYWQYHSKWHKHLPYWTCTLLLKLVGMMQELLAKSCTCVWDILKTPPRRPTDVDTPFITHGTGKCTAGTGSLGEKTTPCFQPWCYLEG